MRSFVALLIALAACGPADQPRPTRSAQTGLITADDICAQIIGAAPPEAREEGWTVVTRGELLESDREIWDTYHSVECPGVAEVDMNGDGHAEFAITSVQRNGGVLLQKLALLRPSGESYTGQSLWGPHEVPFAQVVYETSVPRVSDFYTGETTALDHPGFIFERLEASATAYFEVRGDLRTELISD